MNTMQNDMNDVLRGLGIDGSCVRAETHRHLAFLDVKLETKPTVLRKLERSAKQIALHLRTKTVPIIKLVPEEGVVRLQVALQEAEPIKLLDLYRGQWLPDKMVLPMLLGEDDEGKLLWSDMNHNPHLLVAGGTGSGKSTLLHTIIANVLYVHTLRLRNVFIYLNDPKRVEFTEYNSLIGGVVKNISNSYTETLTQLNELCIMMEYRYEMMRALGMKSIEENPQKLPLIMCVIDEMADLIAQDKKSKKLHDVIVRLAQKGRAAGIFLVLATQRPSVDVLTGLIKANFPGRVACKTASRKDSEVILDRPGAETLLGRGDAVLQNMKCESVRFQVAYTSPRETIANMKSFLNSRETA